MFIISKDKKYPSHFSKFLHFTGNSNLRSKQKMCLKTDDFINTTMYFIVLHKKTKSQHNNNYIVCCYILAETQQRRNLAAVRKVANYETY